MKRMIFGLFLLLLAGCTQVSSNYYEEDDYQKIAEANNRFAFDLHEQLVQVDQNDNIFFSPISIHMALSMTANGASGDTEKQMLDVLHSDHMSIEQLNRGHASFLDLIAKKDYGVTLNIGNSLWLKEDYPFVKNFVDDVNGYYRAEVNEVDFLQEKTKGEINNWVKNKTNNKIDKIVEQIDPSTVLYLINAIYFKGDWDSPFNDALTYEDSFTLPDGNTKRTPFMVQDGEFNYFENNHFQAIELPYANHDASMFIFLPKEDVNLEQFYDNLSLEAWNSWKSQFAKREGTITLPKFQMEYETVLNDILMELGMTDAFTASADFTNMVDGGGVAVSEVRHKSFIEVNEQGTEAAAATSVAVVELAAPVDSFTMHVNRPFFFLIEENSSQMILFMGEVSEPQ